MIVSVRTLVIARKQRCLGMADNIEEAIRLRHMGHSVAEIARLMVVNPRTVSKWFAAAGDQAALPAPVQTIDREFDAVAQAIVNRCASAIEKLDAQNASPSQMAASLPALAKAMKLVPKQALPSPASSSEEVLDIQEIREKFYRALCVVVAEEQEKQGDKPSPFELLKKRMEDRGLVKVK